MTGALLNAVTLTGWAFSGGSMSGLPGAGLAAKAVPERAAEGDEFAELVLRSVSGATNASVFCPVETDDGVGDVVWALATGERR